MVKLDDIRSLAKKQDLDIMLVALYKYICLFLNDYLEGVEEYNYVDHFINNVFPKYNQDSISIIIN